MTMQAHQLKQAIQLIESRLGLSAKTLSHIGLGDLLQQISSGSISDYISLLQSSDEHSPVWQRLIHALTIGETYFLRDKAHFRILRETILPRIILERRQANDLRLTIWSMGCSTGEEAYSIATTLYETLPDWNKWRINLLATDINQRAINSAQAGLYRDWSFRHVPDSYRQRYFKKTENAWQLALNIRNRVSFMRMNILNGSPTHQADIIFARHILMYLAPEYIEKAEAVLYESLVPNGWLFLGQAEALHSQREAWQLYMFPGTPIYQKIDPQSAPKEPVAYPIQTSQVAQSISKTTTEKYQQAIEAIQTDKRQHAEEYLSDILNEHPHHAQARIVMAAIFASRQAYPEAQAHLKIALEQDALLADAHYVSALIQSEQGAINNAIQSLNAALYCNQKHILATLLLGQLQRKQGKFEEAQRQWRNALKMLVKRDENAYLSEFSELSMEQVKNLLSQQLSDLNL